ncbi:hypothetical protein AAMO2058_001719200, partial [Amorphochlora amoebiformis]
GTTGPIAMSEEIQPQRDIRGMSTSRARNWMMASSNNQPTRGEISSGKYTDAKDSLPPIKDNQGMKNEISKETPSHGLSGDTKSTAESRPLNSERDIKPDISRGMEISAKDTQASEGRSDEPRPVPARSRRCVDCYNYPGNPHRTSENIYTGHLITLRPVFFKKTKRNTDRSCSCKRSQCLKRYCECFQARQPCWFRCACNSCRNPHGVAPKPPDTGKHITSAGSETAEHVEKALSTIIKPALEGEDASRNSPRPPNTPQPPPKPETVSQLKMRNDPSDSSSAVNPSSSMGESSIPKMSMSEGKSVSTGTGAREEEGTAPIPPPAPDFAPAKPEPSELSETSSELQKEDDSKREDDEKTEAIESGKGGDKVEKPIPEKPTTEKASATAPPTGISSVPNA